MAGIVIAISARFTFIHIETLFFTGVFQMDHRYLTLIALRRMPDHLFGLLAINIGKSYEAKKAPALHPAKHRRKVDVIADRLSFRLRASMTSSSVRLLNTRD